MVTKYKNNSRNSSNFKRCSSIEHCSKLGNWCFETPTLHIQTVGILPDDTSDNANPFIDTAVATGQGIARNIIIVRTADILIAAGGGAGTLSEIAFAWQLEKKVLCLTSFEGWAKELAGKNLDDRQNGLLISVNSIDEILKHFDND